MVEQHQDCLPAASVPELVGSFWLGNTFVAPPSGGIWDLLPAASLWLCHSASLEAQGVAAATGYDVYCIARQCHMVWQCHAMLDCRRLKSHRHPGCTTCHSCILAPTCSANLRTKYSVRLNSNCSPERYWTVRCSDALQFVGRAGLHNLSDASFADAACSSRCVNSMAP